MSEIASCSYEAREKGLRNGMFLGGAKALCPDLICVPYKFQSYRSVSQTFYEILASYTSEIEAVSCDEALLDISDLITEGNRIHFFVSFTDRTPWKCSYSPIICIKIDCI